MLELDPTLPAELGPLQWLIGTWEGTGVLSFPVGERTVEQEFGQRVSFAHHGNPYLSFEAYAWQLDDELTPLAAESGFWRLARPAHDADAGPGMLPPAGEPAFGDAEAVEGLRRPDGAFDLQALISHPTGVSELYLGTISGPRIELATDAVLRGAGAKEHTASTRMYGLVENHLLWAWDLAALGQGLESHASARLARVTPSEASDA
ncbi:FABP family protein [Agrococcus sp. ARC_14]|uniref:FABP family protein n=1 Tax=Agrococcus sp. ARC_14 TaxID=2919927 RepID=UPI001F06932D|nr:FABP family protein [Agrococcus sp. ARC_14]MCH1884382.1 FABP family protein [Agrococcus sp. ARC_14]